MTQKNRWRAGAARATAARTAHATAATMTAAALLAAGALGAGPAAAVDGPVGNSSELPGASGSAAGSAAVDTLIPGDPLFNDPAADPFYQPPESIPAPGTVIRTQPAQHLLQMTGIDWPGTAEKIMYASTRGDGTPVAVTGVVFEPTAAWDGDGARPTVILAPGTMGQGRQCAPSLGKGMFLNIDPGIPTAATDYELISVYAALIRGARVVMTDYIGLGTPGLHTYVNSADEAHAVLDAGRAALAHGGLPADAPVGIMGYSQGGGATASAAERAADYAPELAIAASYAGAPPADLRQVMSHIDGTTIAPAIGYALNSGLVYRPELEHLIDEHLNDRGKQFVASVRDQCIVDSVATWGLTETKSLTLDGAPFSSLLDEIPEVSAYIDEQRLGMPGRVPDHPIRIDSSTADDVIPTGQVTQLARDYCAQGGHVDFDVHDYPVVLQRSGAGHVIPMLANLPHSVSFLMDAFHGKAAPSNCGSF